MNDQDPAWEGGALANTRSNRGIDCLDGQSTDKPPDTPPSRSAPSDPITAPASAPIAEAASGLLHASAAFPIALNERWRVSFDPLQWILERRRGERWIASSFCVTRQALLRNIRERSGEVDPDALAKVNSLQPWHPDRGEP